MKRAETDVGVPTTGSRGSSSTRGGLPGSVEAARQWLLERRLVVVVGLAAALPVLVAMGQRVAVDWVPLGDNAVIAVRSLDVFTGDSPLVGQWSSGPSQALGDDVYAPGPLLYWLLAVPSRLPDEVWLELTMGLVSLASVMGVVGLAHRRGGRPLMFAVAIAIPIMLASIPSEALSDIWNPTVPLLPFMLLTLLAWSLACGEYRLLPLTALVGSFVIQGHLSYVPPALGLLAIGVGGLVIFRRSVRRRGHPARRWMVASIVVSAICWSAPVLDQAIHRPGNFVQLARAAVADDPTLGPELGWRALVRTVGVVPWWLRDPQTPLERIADLSDAPGVVATGSTVLVLLGLAAIAVVGFRRRRIEVLTAGAIGLVLCASMAFVAASTPKAAFAGTGYTLRWASPAGMWVWLVLGWSLVTLSSPRLRPAPRPPRILAPVAGVALVAGVAAVVALGAEPRREPFDGMRAIADRLDTDLPRTGVTRVDGAYPDDATFMGLDFQVGVVYALRRDGMAVVAPAHAQVLGSKYDASDASDAQLLLVDIDRPPPARGRVIERLAVPQLSDPDDPFAPKTPPKRAVTVTVVAPGDIGPRAAER